MAAFFRFFLKPREDDDLPELLPLHPDDDLAELLPLDHPPPLPPPPLPPPPLPLP